MCSHYFWFLKNVLFHFVCHFSFFIYRVLQRGRAYSRYCKDAKEAGGSQPFFMCLLPFGNVDLGFGGISDVVLGP